MTTMENQLHTRWGRFKTYLDLLFVDHAIFRLAYHNRHEVAPGLYRSNGPMPHHVRRAARRGIKTLVNLRGHNQSSWYHLEEEACHAHGVTLVDFPVKSRGAPAKETLHKAKALFETIAYPAQMHCKSGADRAALMAVLYLIMIKGEPVAQAIRHLNWRYGHVKASKTGIIDHFFATFARDTAARPMAFLDWVDQVYDPEALAASFKPGLFGRTLGDVILRRE